MSAALFVLALAFIASAEDYAVTPDERLMYYPEAKVSAEALDEQRGLQRQDENLLSIYYNKRVLPSVNLAVLDTLIGLSLVVLSKGWSPGTIIAAIATLAVGLVYLIDWRKGNNWWLFPRPILPPWSEWQLKAKYPGELTKKQLKHKRRDEMMSRPVPRAAMGEDGRRAMLGGGCGVCGTRTPTANTPSELSCVSHTRSGPVWSALPGRWIC